MANPQNDDISRVEISDQSTCLEWFNILTREMSSFWTFWTFDIAQAMSFVPTPKGRLDTYCGTFDIVQAISFVPDTLGRLDPYCGTFDIA